MAKAVEHGVRSPKESPKADKQEKSVSYGIRSVSDSFEKRANEVNTPPAPKRYVAPGAKFDSKEPSFKKFR
jgi:hypothetical protein